MLPVRKLKPGERLKVEKKTYVTGEHADVGGKRKEYEEVRVIKQHPHHVLVENRYGSRRCISNAEIYGILMQESKVESGLHDKNGEKICVEERERSYPELRH